MNNENEDNINCSLLDYADEFWLKYKHHSGKVSIALSILGGVSAILVGKYIIVGSIAIAITNASVFMSGIAYEKLNTENTKMTNENKSLQNEKNDLVRRLTHFHFPHDASNITPSNGTPNNSNASTSTNYEEVKEFKLNRNIIIDTSPDAFKA